MKQVLSLLTAFVFLQMQTWALSGGPVYPTGAPNLAGVYSGVMDQVDARFGNEFDDPHETSSSNKDLPAGNIGVYSVTIAQTGLNTGTFLLFVNGTLFTGGSMIGVADPDKMTFDATMSANANFTDANGNAIVVAARGQMRTKITEKRGTPLPGRTSTSFGIAARMDGTALIDAFTNTNTNMTPIPLVQVKYKVSGFRQTTTALPTT